MARRAVGMARGLRGARPRPGHRRRSRGRRRPTRSPAAADRFLASLDRLVWPYPASPARRLLDARRLRAGRRRRLVTDEGLVAALEQLRDARRLRVVRGVPRARSPRGGGARRSRSRRPTSSTRSHEADYLATTGGSRSTGTPVELSFAWQRRQGVQRAIQFDRAGVRGAADCDLAARVPVRRPGSARS